MKLIAIAGCSGSGKTVLAEALSAEFGGAPVIALDAYYHPQSDLPLEQRALTNYDHPDALDWRLLEAQLTALLLGVPVEIPVYRFDVHTRARESASVEPRELILVEGILALHRAEIRALADLSVFVDTAERECFHRRLARDVAERGRTTESVHQQYRDSVRPMALEYVLPSRAYADLVVSGERPVSEAVAAISALRRNPASLVRATGDRPKR